MASGTPIDTSQVVAFIEFLRRNIGDIENITNGNYYYLPDDDMRVLRPDGVSDTLLRQIVKAALDLHMEHDLAADYYYFWYDPL